MLKFFQFAVFLIVCDKINSFPDDIEKCRIDDEECLVRSSNIVLKRYIEGITEIGFQSMNPFIVDETPIKHNLGIFTSNGIILNTQAFGYSNAVVEKFSGFDKNLLEVNFKMPKLTISGTFKGKVNVLGFKIEDEEPGVLNFYDVSIKLTIKLERFTRNEKEYFRTIGSVMSMNSESGDIEAPEVNRPFAWMLSSSYKILAKSSMSSYVTDNWRKFYEQAINAVLNKVSIEDLFLK